MTAPSAPALYETTIRHVRTDPVRNSFSYRSFSWFVDVDDLPRLARPLRPFARIRADDHLRPPGTDLRARVDAFLAENDAECNGKITALLNARVLGYVFNPLSLFWCHDTDGNVVHVVAEVHNTYGERHSYLLRTDSAGRATTEKEFYVSPFYEVAGTYEMSLPEPSEQLSVRIVLRRNGQAPFVATVAGVRRAATTANILRTQLRNPLAPLAVSARIRKQGIALWARGVPVVSRVNTAPREEAIQ